MATTSIPEISQFPLDPNIELQRDQFDAAFDMAIRNKKILKVPYVKTNVHRNIKDSLRMAGKKDLAEQFDYKTFKKLNNLISTKNKSKLVDITLDMQKEQDPRAGLTFLNENNLGHISDPELVNFLADTIKNKGNPTQTPPNQAQIAARRKQAQAAMSSSTPPPSQRRLQMGPPPDIKVETEVGGAEFDATARSKAKSEHFSINKEYQAKKSLTYPWKKTRIRYIEDTFWKEPCFSSMDDIAPNSKKDAYTRNNFTDTFYRAYYSISELPLFGWSNYTREKNKTTFLPRTVSKFLYCFFVKVIGSPLYIAYLAARIVWMLGAPLVMKIPLILAASVNSIVFAVTFILSWTPIGPKRPTQNVIPWYYYKYDKKTGQASDSPVWYYPAFTSLIAGLFGLTIPYQTISPRLGSKYGRGEIGIFIIVVMAISAVIITVTGINIAVIMATFVYFMVKTFLGIREKAMGKDLRQGAK